MWIPTWLIIALVMFFVIRPLMEALWALKDLVAATIAAIGAWVGGIAGLVCLVSVLKGSSDAAEVSGAIWVASWVCGLLAFGAFLLMERSENKSRPKREPKTALAFEHPVVSDRMLETIGRPAPRTPRSHPR